MAYDFRFPYIKRYQREAKKYQTSNNGFWVFSYSILVRTLYCRYSILDSSFCSCYCRCLSFWNTGRLSLDSIPFTYFC